MEVERGTREVCDEFTMNGKCVNFGAIWGMGE